MSIKRLLSAATLLCLSSQSAVLLASLPAQAGQSLAASNQTVKAPLPPTTPVGNIKQPAESIAFGLIDGIVVKLKFKQEVSSKTARVNDTVEFEVAEAVLVNNRLVIPQGASAKGVVVTAQEARMLGRKGKLEISLTEVTLASQERVALRADQEEGGGLSTGVIAAAAIVSPLFLLMKGKNITYEPGAELTAYIDGTYALQESKFKVVDMPQGAPLLKPLGK